MCSPKTMRSNGHYCCAPYFGISFKTLRLNWRNLRVRCFHIIQLHCSRAGVSFFWQIFDKHHQASPLDAFIMSLSVLLSSLLFSSFEIPQFAHFFSIIRVLIELHMLSPTPISLDCLDGSTLDSSAIDDPHDLPPYSMGKWIKRYGAFLEVFVCR